MASDFPEATLPCNVPTYGAVRLILSFFLEMHR